MKYLYQIKVALLYYWRTFKFIESHNLWKILALPAIFNLILSVVTVILSIKTSGFIWHRFTEIFHPAGTDRELTRFVEGFLLVIIRASVFFVYLKIYKYVMLIMLAPLFVPISSKIQTIATGQPPPDRPGKYLYECGRAMSISLRNFIIDILLSSALIVVSLLIVWIIPITPLVILGIESYFIGYAMTDYRNMHFNMNKKESRKLMWQLPGLVLGNGMFFNLFLLIPVVGSLLAPTFALISSGLAFNCIEKRKNILCDSDQSILLTAKS